MVRLLMHLGFGDLWFYGFRVSGVRVLVHLGYRALGLVRGEGS